MIVGLVGPSCSGKSFLSSVVKERLNFILPVGLTTRSIREKDNGSVIHVSRDLFFEMEKAGNLSFVAKVFGHYYAYLRKDLRGNCIVEISASNIKELNSLGGVLIRVMPHSFFFGLRKLLVRRSKGKARRIIELASFYVRLNGELSNQTFYNKYDEESSVSFVAFVKSLVADKRGA